MFFCIRVEPGTTKEMLATGRTVLLVITDSNSTHASMQKPQAIFLEGEVTYDVCGVVLKLVREYATVDFAC